MNSIANNTMTNTEHIYVVGDLQGCCDQFNELHAQILLQDPDATLFIAGDLVNRGPQSLPTLRKLVALGDRANSVLGNHDLNLLGIAYGAHRPHHDAYLRPILDAPDREQLLDWLRHRPLAFQIEQHLIIHAGVLPSWTVEQTLDYAREVEQMLQGPNYVDFLRVMYSNQPSVWSTTLTGMDRLRCIVNVLTRLRFCTISDEMEFDSKEGLNKTPPGFAPWFSHPRLSASSTLIYGHWSAIGLQLQPNLIGLDTGCVWGGKLTAMRLSDHQLFQVDCPPHQEIN
ncbi:symmetrical bis(5'-nucleosyl)-tetraphosphatase [Solimicrobium silvestre]|uniref:bis(5'-nucleosyl)-tetraphosphatase (symmetrical) n=1 Tax=Solimicrobium silvestre TaxID=2099400 RepID=A0A2S9GTQ1_9BURK|nr:symmetrical bis(5'-nucleosyl)-tetraphosphatase [Solimicrobium silvestre]PRC91095.1 apaH: bis(5'-nucleosyl)-tetraphosphatase (symmetrical) [Solimicrobium silvestre]